MDNRDFLKFKRMFANARAIIFDFDGVLADSEKHHFASYRDVFAKYGHDINETEYYDYWTSRGLGARGEIERFNLDLDPVKMTAEKAPVFSEYCRDGSIKLFPEALEILERLDRTDKILSIASGSTRDDIEAILGNAGATHFFKSIIGKDTVPKIKPAPDIFLKMLDTLEMEPYECLVIEDADKGVQAAVTSQIPVIVVRTAETRDFEFGLADLVIDSHQTLLKMIRQIYPNPEESLPGEASADDGHTDA